MINRRWAAYIELLPPVLYLGVFFLIPLLMSIAWGFWPRTESGFWITPGITLAGYEEFFLTGRLNPYVRSVKFAVITVIVTLILGYPVAYYTGRMLNEDQSFALLMVFILPFVLSTIVWTLSWFFVLNQSGPVHAALTAIGFSDGQINWLLFSEFSVLVGLVTSTIPFVIFPNWLVIRTINDEFIEASADLGAHPLITFKNVTLPLSLPGIFAGSLFVFTTALGATTIPNILGGEGFTTIGSSILSVMGTLNYQLASVISTFAFTTMVFLIFLWAYFFDITDVITFEGGK